MRLFLLFAATALAACGGYPSFQQWGRVAGSEQRYSFEPWRAFGERDVVVDQASREFACADSQLAFTRPSDRSYIVTGCDHRGIFAVDLACPAEHVTPDFIPQGLAPALPVVEGCGKRATYLSETDPEVFRLSSLVTLGASEAGGSRP